MTPWSHDSGLIEKEEKFIYWKWLLASAEIPHFKFEARSGRRGEPIMKFVDDSRPAFREWTGKSKVRAAIETSGEQAFTRRP